jgi:2-desacetyl-2-hydroxyethyl bacteriochlorophyllide A dehydrogenase
MNRRALVFAAPRRVELAEETLAGPAPGHLLVRTTVSAISAGTELLAFRGQLPASLALDDTLGAMAGSTFTYPFRYGYASVGDVIALGEGVQPSWLGRSVFAFQPHASAFTVSADDAIPVPADVAPERAALFANMETAVNLVLDGRPLLGERVVVLGQGIVGLLTTALLARFPLERLVAVEGHPLRAEAARALGAHEVLAPGSSLGSGADLVYELSGSPAVLDAAIAAAGQEARVVVGSWYGDKRAPIDLGGRFHRGRLRLVSSQVSHIASDLAPRWDRPRRWAVAFRALAAVDTARLCTHRFPLTDAQRAYDLLDREPERTIQVLFTS